MRSSRVRRCRARSRSIKVPALSAGTRRRRSADHAERHRHGDQRPDGRDGASPDRRRRGRQPVHRDGHREHGAGRPRLLRDDGLRRAGRARRAGGDRRAAARARRRRRVPDDRLGAGQLPALRLGSDCRDPQQRELGDAADVPARVEVQRSRRMALRRHGGRRSAGTACACTRDASCRRLCSVHAACADAFS